MLRRTRPLTWLGILAMLAQLLLPAVHAAGFAQRHGDPLAYAICGAGSPALQALLRERLPAEVLDTLDGRVAAAELPDCELCASVHGATAAAAPAAAPVLALDPDAAVAAATLPGVGRNHAPTPPARAPPTPG